MYSCCSFVAVRCIAAAVECTSGSDLHTQQCCCKLSWMLGAAVAVCMQERLLVAAAVAVDTVAVDCTATVDYKPDSFGRIAVESSFGFADTSSDVADCTAHVVAVVACTCLDYCCCCCCY